MRNIDLKRGNMSQYYIDPNKLILEEKDNNEKKYNEFIKRINEFKDITSLNDAKNLAKKILPVVNQINFLKIGDAKCTILNKDDLFRISLDSDNEFICYNFE